MIRIQKFALLLTVLTLLTIAGCKKEEIGPDGNTPPPGTFKAYMADSPADYEAVNVEIVKVEAYVEGSGWITMNNETRTVNVLSLTNGAQMELTSAAEIKSELGTYSKLRITFGDHHSLTLNAAAAMDLGILGGGSAEFDMTYSGPKSIELTINERVNARKGAAVLVDFDAAQSVYYDLNHFVLRPTLKIVKNSTTGVKGHVAGTATATVTLVNETGSYSSYINANGDFLIRGMDDGVYELIVMPARTLDNHEEPQPKRINGVAVARGEFTSVGSIHF